MLPGSCMYPDLSVHRGAFALVLSVVLGVLGMELRLYALGTALTSGHTQALPCSFTRTLHFQQSPSLCPSALPCPL